jgi:Integrase core domain
MRSRKRHNSRRSHWRAGYSETGPPGSEGGHAEKDLVKQAPRCVADPTQTMKNWLRAQPNQPTSIAELQTLLDTFVPEYNHHRPHHSLPHRATPATVYTSRPKATPSERSQDTHDRVRRDRVAKTGKITLRHSGRLYSIGIGRTHTGTRVLVLVQDLDIRIIDAATGQLIRELVLDPTQRYQATGRPPGPTR